MASKQAGHSGPWLLAGTLALLVAVALAATVGSAAWIAKSGDKVREDEDRGMLVMAFASQRALLSDLAEHTAASIASLGPDATGPVATRIAALLSPGARSRMRHNARYLLRDGGRIVSSDRPPRRCHGARADPVIKRHEPVMTAHSLASPVGARGDGAGQPFAWQHGHGCGWCRELHFVCKAGRQGLRNGAGACRRKPHGARPGRPDRHAGCPSVRDRRGIVARMAGQHRVTDLRISLDAPPAERAILHAHRRRGQRCRPYELAARDAGRKRLLRGHALLRHTRPRALFPGRSGRRTIPRAPPASWPPRRGWRATRPTMTFDGPAQSHGLRRGSRSAPRGGGRAVHKRPLSRPRRIQGDQ